MPFNEHIKKWEDLVTTHKAIRAGFISIAFEKNIKGSPFIEEAKSLKIITSKLKKPEQLLELKDIYPALLTAAGQSEKSLNYLLEEDKKAAINELIEKFLVPAGKDFADELVYRYLLTKGDALGGIMRNLVGALSERKLIRSLISTLALKGISFKYYNKQSFTWIDGVYEDTSIEENTKYLFWLDGKKKRVIAFNITPPFISKNVDFCLLDGDYVDINNGRSSIHKMPEKYIALGELKGGIDPAGADEHWKTANTALERIREAFEKLKFNPSTFFIGAAIANSMAKEIYEQLVTKKLTNAANLTADEQLVSIVSWICSL